MSIYIKGMETPTSCYDCPVKCDGDICGITKGGCTWNERPPHCPLVSAADARPVVRGKWIKYAPHNSDMMTCSVCEKYLLLDGDQYDYHFCPICGADMREPPKEE